MADFNIALGILIQNRKILMVKAYERGVYISPGGSIHLIAKDYPLVQYLKKMQYQY